MNLLSSLFGNNKNHNESQNVNWIPLTKTHQLDELIAQSSEKPILIFKHSTRCGISRMALRQFESAFDSDEIVPYFLDLLAHRDISNAIALQFHVPHQSPQLLLIKDGKCLYDASHGDIDAVELKHRI